MNDFGKKELRDLICETLSIPKTTNTIERQINRFVMELGFSYKEIGRAVVYGLTIKKITYESIFGIGFVQNIIPEANKYFENLKKEKEKQLKSIEEANKQSDIILTGKPKNRRKIKTIDIEKLNVE